MVGFVADDIGVGGAGSAAGAKPASQRIRATPTNLWRSGGGVHEAVSRGQRHRRPGRAEVGRTGSDTRAVDLWAAEQARSSKRLYTYFFDRVIPWPAHPEFGASTRQMCPTSSTPSPGSIVRGSRWTRPSRRRRPGTGRISPPRSIQRPRSAPLGRLRREHAYDDADRAPDRRDAGGRTGQAAVFPGATTGIIRRGFRMPIIFDKMCRVP